MRDFQKPGRSAVFTSQGACATSHPFAAREAVKMMEDGGNAMDAAITAAVLLGLCEPSSTGVGGDLFTLIKPANSDLITGFNASGKAPWKIDAQDLRDRGEVEVGIGSVDAITIPGAVDGFCRLAEDWGRKGIQASLAPAIRYAEEGVPVGPRTALDWAYAGFRLTGDGAGHFLKDGTPYRVGEIFRAPGQAEVFRRISAEGRDGFYGGEVLDDMLSSLKALGGVHEASDFATPTCNYCDPVSSPYGDVELIELPPNGQGVTALLMAKILSHFDMKSMDAMGSMRAHIEAEAAKLAYDARNRFVADPEYMGNLLDHMLSDETAAKLARLIDSKRASDTPPPLAADIHAAAQKDTVYLTTADREGMVVSMIYSIFYPFGSGYASSKFGINFQNRGAGFTLAEGHPNELKGGKRPMHTIIPAMIRRNGKVIASYGVMGGQYQSAGHIRVLSNMFDFGMSPQEALDAARSFPDPDSGMLQIERGYSDEVKAELAAMGHQLAEPDMPIGGGQMIRIHENGVYEAASDPRKDGCALGY